MKALFISLAFMLFFSISACSDHGHNDETGHGHEHDSSGAHEAPKHHGTIN
jgi:hypothetical protein